MESNKNQRNVDIISVLKHRKYLYGNIEEYSRCILVVSDNKHKSQSKLKKENKSSQ